MYKKIWDHMEELPDETDDNIPTDDIRKKNIKIFRAQGKPTASYAFCKGFEEQDSFDQSR